VQESSTVALSKCMKSNILKFSFSYPQISVLDHFQAAYFHYVMCWVYILCTYNVVQQLVHVATHVCFALENCILSYEKRMICPIPPYLLLCTQDILLLPFYKNFLLEDAL